MFLMDSIRLDTVLPLGFLGFYGVHCLCPIYGNGRWWWHREGIDPGTGGTSPRHVFHRNKCPISSSRPRPRPIPRFCPRIRPSIIPIFIFFQI